MKEPRETLAAVPFTPVVVPLSPVPDPVRLLRAFADRPGRILFDSASVATPLGRFSFFSADPVGRFERLVPSFGEDPFLEFREVLGAYPTSTIPDLPPFQGGLAGCLGYELGRCWEDWPAARWDELTLPPLSAGLYDWTIAWDHRGQSAWLISQGLPEIDPQARRERAEARAAWVLDRLNEDHVPQGRPGESAVDPSVAVPGQQAPRHPVRDIPGLTSDFTEQDYPVAVARVIEYIRAGDIFQANLSQMLLARSPLPATELYVELRRTNPAPFAGFYDVGGWVVASASPERFVRVRDRRVETRPIKGTRRRSRTAAADLFSRDALRESDKDRAENVMIVDLMRNDLSRVCRPGSVRVPALCQVETYQTVQHLVSVVEGELEQGRDVWDLLAAALPGGSITGAPKIRAMRIIAEIEPTVRGPYTGNLFYHGLDGTFDSSILIRSYVLRDGWVQCGVGGGIVARSDPRLEYEETWHKAAAMLGPLGLKRL